MFITARLSPAMFEQVRDLAASQDRSVSSEVRRAIGEHLATKAAEHRA
jgi:predicted transcriptional regulator